MLRFSRYYARAAQRPPSVARARLWADPYAKPVTVLQEGFLTRSPGGHPSRKAVIGSTFVARRAGR